MTRLNYTVLVQQNATKPTTYKAVMRTPGMPDLPIGIPHFTRMEAIRDIDRRKAATKSAHKRVADAHKIAFEFFFGEAQHA